MYQGKKGEILFENNGEKFRSKSKNNIIIRNYL